MSGNETTFPGDWKALKKHLQDHKTDLLLLPELPFSRWIAAERHVTHAEKLESIENHERWREQMHELEVKQIVYSKPVLDGDRFFNTATIYEKGKGDSKIHSKCYFPDEPFFWEESWYNAEEPRDFAVLDTGEIKIGVLLCSEMWFTEHARSYARQGVDILLCPRATGSASRDKWIRCGQTLAVISGAYCLSSNRSGVSENDFEWAGSGWIAEPISGNLLGVTSAAEKFITREIDIEMSRKAKFEYPLNVRE